MSMAEDSDHNGNIFQAETEVVPIGDPLLLPEQEAEKWKPSTIPWTAFILPAPGQVEASLLGPLAQGCKPYGR